MNASRARRALNALLAMHPSFDLLEVDWQHDDPQRLHGPWLLVTLGQRSADGGEVWARHPYAIFKRTGAVHGMHNGAVTDEPIFTL